MESLAKIIGLRIHSTSKAKVVVGLSLNENGRPQYVKMEVVDDPIADTINAFAEANITTGSTISSDAYRSYKRLKDNGYQHHPKVFNPNEDKDLRIRTAMMERDWNYILTGIVEVDDAFSERPMMEGNVVVDKRHDHFYFYGKI